MMTIEISVVDKALFGIVIVASFIAAILRDAFREGMRRLLKRNKKN
jgi:hypothetical protein